MKNSPPTHTETLQIGARWLPATLEVPPQAQAVVVFVHGSGSNRTSPRNRQVADLLRQHGLATLRMDLLTEDEVLDRRCLFDIRLLARRVGEALDLLDDHPWAASRPVGLFGASTGAAAALVVAVERPEQVQALVTRGGRLDLALDWWPDLRAPTLLVAGAADPEVLVLNQGAFDALHCPKRFEVVPGATHLFEQPGALETVAKLAGDWFTRHLVPAPEVPGA